MFLTQPEHEHPFPIKRVPNLWNYPDRSSYPGNSKQKRRIEGDPLAASILGPVRFIFNGLLILFNLLAAPEREDD